MVRFIVTPATYVGLVGLVTSSIGLARPQQVAVSDASPECQIYWPHLGEETQALDQRLKALNRAKLEPLQKFKALLCLPPNESTLQYVGNFFANLDLTDYTEFSLGPTSVPNKRSGLQPPQLSSNQAACAVPAQETPETMVTKMDRQWLLQCHPFVYGIQVGHDPVVNTFQEQIYDASHDVYPVASQYQQIATEVMIDAVKGAIALDDAQFVVSAYLTALEEQEKGPYRNQYVLWALRFTPIDALNWARRLTKTETVHAIREMLRGQKNGSAMGRHWYQMFMA
ncbi:hypothetical protein H4R35_004329 [Dimargaris xerosporica]|nr:hypothetical protein H4R35_004329 [Dimargaris xerosporica]